MQKLILSLYITICLVNFICLIYYLIKPRIDDFSSSNKIILFFFLLIFSFISGPIIIHKWFDKKKVNIIIKRFERKYNGD